MFIISIALTTALYVLIGYMSYITASILFQGLRYRLVVPTVKSFLFIGVSYISIISDVILFGNFMYSYISIKNGLLLLLTAASILSASGRRETTHGHKRE